MKLFPENRSIDKIITFTASVALLVLSNSCATYHEQYGSNFKKAQLEVSQNTKKVSHTFYLVGDAGNADEIQAQQTLDLLKSRLNTASKNSTLLFLGDNIYPKGYPAKGSDGEIKLAETKLDNQLQLAENFKGKTIFLPGNHDWYNGLKGLELQSQYVTTRLRDKKAFMPRKGCPIDDVKIDSTTTIITVDSEWFLEDWDEHPTINDNCDIKTREDFFDELESVLNKNQEKMVILAIHHPLLSNGTHGGQFSLRKQLFPLESNIPLPVFGSVINLLRKTTGVSPQDIQNKQYTLYTKRIKALLQKQKNVIVVSGHDHNLQFVNHENINQIISGAGSKSEAARAIRPDDFSYGGNGYAQLTLYTNGDANIAFYAKADNAEKLVFQKDILKPVDQEWKKHTSNSFSKTTSASIYTNEMTAKSGFHKFLFGKHYRSYYSLPIQATNATLDTLKGGLKPVREGGGHQSISLRLRDPDGREYVMRGLKKSATQFLQSVAFKDQYVVSDFEDTYVENFLLDFYTASHPYTPFAVGSMADKIGLLHTNPKLYYIPKQIGLKEFNTGFGNQLYMIEERAADNHLDAKNFGNPTNIISTGDLLKNLHKDEKYIVDEKEYIRARLFDMLIGDWDRHDDQWRWAENKVGDKIIYRPIARDRDQAFVKYDGALLSILMNIPVLRHMKTFKGKINNVKWLNREPYPLDLALIKNNEDIDWLSEVKYIQDNLTDASIDQAFKALPKEVQDNTLNEIASMLKQRRNDLAKYALQYARVLSKTVMIAGTDKKDKFIINHAQPHKVTLEVYRVKSGGDELQYTKTYNDKITKQLWLYGLDDNDIFEVKGKAKSSMIIRLIGGQNHDSYTIENGRNVRIYDFKSKENTYQLDQKTRKVLTDDYDVNLYNYEKPKYNVVSGLPTAGYNPDDGVKVGVSVNYTVNNFKQNPYTQRHVLNGYYYFATGGFELDYKANFPGLLGDWVIDVDSKYTTPNFAINYFGHGNESLNNDKNDGMDFNRVRIQKFRLASAIRHVGRNGSEVYFQPRFEQFQVENTAGRLISNSNTIAPKVFDSHQFAGVKFQYSYRNSDFVSKPTMGMSFLVAGTWTTNLNDSKQNFPELEGNLSFVHKIDSNGKIIFATILKSKALLNSNYEFYQGVTLGGDSDLRGFRTERFLGNTSFSHSSDLRFTLGKLHKSFIPLTYGLLTGFDYGRIWLKNESSSKWHNDYGGGIWVNAINVLTARVSYFKSAEEHGRVVVGAAYSF